MWKSQEAVGRERLRKKRGMGEVLEEENVIS